MHANCGIGNTTPLVFTWTKPTTPPASYTNTYTSTSLIATRNVAVSAHYFTISSCHRFNPSFFQAHPYPETPAKYENKTYMLTGYHYYYYYNYYFSHSIAIRIRTDAAAIKASVEGILEGTNGYKIMNIIHENNEKRIEQFPLSKLYLIIIIHYDYEWCEIHQLSLFLFHTLLQHCNIAILKLTLPNVYYYVELKHHALFFFLKHLRTKQKRKKPAAL